MAGRPCVFIFENVEVREREFSIVKAGEVSAVEPKAFRVLLMLLRNPGKLITKEELLNAVWGDAAVTDNSLARSIALLRRLLGDEARDPRFIDTVATVGYRFVCEVEVLEDESGNLQTSGETSANGDAVDSAAVPSPQIDKAAGEQTKSGMRKYGGSNSLRSWLLSGAAILAVGLGAAIWTLHRPLRGLITSLTAHSPRVLRVAVSLPASQGLVDTGCNAVQFTPDGSAIVYSGRGPRYNQLFYRRLDELEGTALPGTEGVCWPAISPTGDWIAFESDSTVSKVSVYGGAPIKLADVTYQGGLSWGPDDSIYSAEAGAGLFRIPANGGPKQRIAVPNPAKHESEWFMPLALADGKAVLAWSRGDPQGSIGSILVKVRIADGKVTELDGEATNPIGVAGGYLLFGRVDGTLGVAPFDPASTRSVEGVIAVLDTPLYAGNGVKASISRAGDLVYVKAAGSSRIVFLDAEGHITGGIPGERDFDTHGPQVSPDGREIVVGEFNHQPSRSDLWLYDVASGARRPLTNGVNAMDPEWTPDGRRVTYRLWPENGPAEAWWAPADRSGPAERLLAMPVQVTRVVLSPDSRYAVVVAKDPAAKIPELSRNIYLVDLKGDRKPQPLEKSPFVENYPRISPDGHWMAYDSDESGRDEVYLRPFPGGGAHVEVSADGGSNPRWEKDSRGIVYRNGDRFMRARLALGSSVTVTQRDLLFTGPYTGYDLLPNGGFVALRPGSADAEIIVVTNFISELKAKQGK